MSHKTIGMLGGMGPEASLNCFAKIISNTPAEKDQDHIRVVMDSNPKIPDRTGAILAGGESPLPALEKGCAALAAAGADFIIIPCVTAHYFLAELAPLSKLPIISILDVVTTAIKAADLKKVGLVSTRGTAQSGIFQKRLAKDGVETLLPDEADIERIMAAIYDIKASRPSRSRKEITADLADCSENLIKGGAQGVIAGCTEIPLALSQQDISRPYFDSLDLLAKEAIIRAGARPPA